MRIKNKKATISLNLKNGNADHHGAPIIFKLHVCLADFFSPCFVRHYFWRRVHRCAINIGGLCKMSKISKMIANLMLSNVFDSFGEGICRIFRIMR
jgi:hypothetical protein